MRSEKMDSGEDSRPTTDRPRSPKAKALLESSIADSIDLLVEYLVENGATDIHPLIMGEVEKRLIIKVLEQSRGNKVQAAKRLGMSRNTFHRKIQKLVHAHDVPERGAES